MMPTPLFIPRLRPRALFLLHLCFAGLWAVDSAAEPLIDVGGGNPPAATATQDVEPSNPSSAADEDPSQEAVRAARTAFEQKNIKGCIEWLIVAKAKRPSLPPPRLVLADMYFQSGNRRAGQALLEQVALENPDHPELYRLFGSLALNDGRWTEAVMHFERALDSQVPSSWTAQQRRDFVVSVKKGLAAAAERRGDKQAAATALGELVELAPSDAKLRDRYASGLFRAGLKDQAYEQFKISFINDKGMSPPELSMGVMCVNAGDYKRADAWFTRAAIAHPGNAKMHFQIAVALMVQDRAEESARHSLKAAELGLESPDLNMVRGYAARQLRAYEAAEILFRKVLQHQPQDAAAMNQLALVLIEQSDSAKQEEALALAETLLKMRNDSGNAKATMGWVLYRSGKLELAEPMLREASSNAAIGPEGLYLAGRAFADQGHDEDAADVAQKLAARIDSPGIYVLRPAARNWLETQSAGGTAEVTP